MPLPMQTTISTTEKATIVVLEGRLDSNSAPQFERSLEDFLHAPKTHLVFDFSRLDYISSAGLRVILNTAKAFKATPYKFVTCSMQDHVYEVFEIAGFDALITIHRDVDESMTAVGT